MSDIVLKELSHRLKPTAKSGSWFCFSDFFCLFARNPGIVVCRAMYNVMSCNYRFISFTCCQQFI